MQKKTASTRQGCLQAERVGFDPTIPFGIRVFETRALGQLCDLSEPGPVYHGPLRRAKYEPCACAQLSAGHLSVVHHGLFESARALMMS